MNDKQASRGASVDAPLGVKDVQAWLIHYCARTLGVERDAIDADKHFDELGLESMMLVLLTEELGRWARIDLDPVSPYDHPTINSFAAYVVRLASEANGVPQPHSK